MEELRLIKTQHPWQDNPYSDPPLGFLSVASAARKEGFEVTLTDLAHEIDIPESPVFGLTASTLEFPGTVNQAKKLKEKFKQVLDKHKIENRPFIAGNLLKQPFLKKFNNQICKNADFINNNCLYIGNNQFVDDERLLKLKRIVDNFFNENS